MRRLMVLFVLLSILLTACVRIDLEDVPTAPEITEPGSTEATYPTLITEPILP